MSSLQGESGIVCQLTSRLVPSLTSGPPNVDIVRKRCSAGITLSGDGLRPLLRYRPPQLLQYGGAVRSHSCNMAALSDPAPAIWLRCQIRPHAIYPRTVSGSSHALSYRRNQLASRRGSVAVSARQIGRRWPPLCPTGRVRAEGAHDITRVAAPGVVRPTDRSKAGRHLSCVWRPPLRQQRQPF